MVGSDDEDAFSRLFRIEELNLTLREARSWSTTHAGLEVPGARGTGGRHEVDEASMKVGELARRTGLTVRALHHYDAVGLLEPEARTAAGHRLYSARDVRRLQRIASLRNLGLSLEEIRACLDDPDYSLARILEIHVRRLHDSIGRQRKLCALLESLLERLDRGEEPSVEELTRTIEGTVDVERYYTLRQLERLAGRREEVGQDRIGEVQREWTELFAAYERAMNAGADPSDGEVLALARRSRELVAEFTGADPGIEASLRKLYQAEGPQKVLSGHGMPMAPGLWEYMGAARRALEASGE